MTQLKNQNTHKMAPRDEKENGSILAGTNNEFRQCPRQDAKPPEKTSELSQDRRQNHQERHQS